MRTNYQIATCALMCKAKPLVAPESLKLYHLYRETGGNPYRYGESETSNMVNEYSP